MKDLHDQSAVLFHKDYSVALLQKILMTLMTSKPILNLFGEQKVSTIMNTFNIICTCCKQWLQWVSEGWPKFQERFQTPTWFDANTPNPENKENQLPSVNHQHQKSLLIKLTTSLIVLDTTLQLQLASIFDFSLPHALVNQTNSWHNQLTFNDLASSKGDMAELWLSSSSGQHLLSELLTIANDAACQKFFDDRLLAFELKVKILFKVAHKLFFTYDQSKSEYLLRNAQILILWLLRRQPLSSILVDLVVLLVKRTDKIKTLESCVISDYFMLSIAFVQMMKERVAFWRSVDPSYIKSQSIVHVTKLPLRRHDHLFGPKNEFIFDDKVKYESMYNKWASFVKLSLQAMIEKLPFTKTIIANSAFSKSPFESLRMNHILGKKSFDEIERHFVGTSTNHCRVQMIDAILAEGQNIEHTDEFYYWCGYVLGSPYIDLANGSVYVLACDALGDPTRDDLLLPPMIVIKGLDKWLSSRMVVSPLDSVEENFKDQLLIKSYPHLVNLFRPFARLFIKRPKLIFSKTFEIYTLSVQSMDDITLIEHESPLCAICAKSEKTMTCANCKSIQYCSIVCQKLAWTKFSHREYCGQMKAYRELMQLPVKQ